MSVCAQWCHWKEDNCFAFTAACKDCVSCRLLLADQEKEVVAAPPELTFRTQVAPDSPFLRYSGYVHIHKDDSRAFFDNRFTQPAAVADPPTTSPGTRISWRSDAERIIVSLHYKRICDENCPTDQHGCYFRGDCICACRVKLIIDGEEVDWKHDGGDHAKGRYVGVHRFEAVHQPSRKVHDFALVWPWCGIGIEFRGLTLQSRGNTGHMHPLQTLVRPTHIAFGDSITAGWCGGEASFPEYLARWNNWESLNVAVPALALTWNKFKWLAPEAIGSGLARLKEAAASTAFITIMLGTNDCGMGKEAETGHQMAAVLDAIRARQPSLPIAVITPIAGFCDDIIMETVRASISSSVLARRDAHLVLVEGRALIPQNDDYFIEEGNPHPNELGVRELALNLEAELGFARVRFHLSRCSAAATELSIDGLTPHGLFTVQYGIAERRESAPAAHIRGCTQRALMLTPIGQMTGVAGSDGRAHATLPKGCTGLLWQVMDSTNCECSRLGSEHRKDGTSGTLASRLLQARPNSTTFPKRPQNSSCGRGRSCNKESSSQLPGQEWKSDVSTSLIGTPLTLLSYTYSSQPPSISWPAPPPHPRALPPPRSLRRQSPASAPTSKPASPTSNANAIPSPPSVRWPAKSIELVEPLILDDHSASGQVPWHPSNSGVAEMLRVIGGLLAGVLLVSLICASISIRGAASPRVCCNFVRPRRRAY